MPGTQQTLQECVGPHFLSGPHGELASPLFTLGPQEEGLSF